MVTMLLSSIPRDNVVVVSLHYISVSLPSIIDRTFCLQLVTYIKTLTFCSANLAADLCLIDCLLHGAAFGKQSIVDNNAFSMPVW